MIEASRPRPPKQKMMSTCPQRDGQDHGGGHGCDVGVEQVGAHAGDVADVVADIVGDNRGIARVVFRNAEFDLAGQVCGDVGGLGEDAAAGLGKQGQGAGAEAEAEHDFSIVESGDKGWLRQPGWCRQRPCP